MFDIAINLNFELFIFSLLKFRTFFIHYQNISKFTKHCVLFLILLAFISYFNLIALVRRISEMSKRIGDRGLERCLRG